MRATATTTQNLIDSLAHAVATEGMAAHRREVAAVADQATAAGVPAVLVETLLDEREPEIVRQRALGAVTQRLAALLACDAAPSTSATPTREPRIPALV